MTNLNHQAENSPTQRLLELIQNKVSNQGDTDKNSTSQPPNAGAALFRLFPAKNTPQIGIEVADRQVKIVGTVPAKSHIRFFLWQVFDIEADLRSEKGTRELKRAISKALTQVGKLPGQGLQFWASAEFSREDYHLLSLPVMKKKDLPSALTWSLKRQFDADLNNSFLDFEILGQVTENAIAKYQILAVLTAKEDILALQRAFARAGYPLTGITPAPLAELNLFRSHCLPSTVPNMALLHIGSQTSRMIISNHQRLLLHRKIRTGGQTFLEEEAIPGPSLETEHNTDLANPESVPQDQVFAPNNQTGQRAEDHQTTSEPEGDRLVRQVERTLTYHTRNLGFDPVQRLYLSGPFAALPEVQPQFARTLGLDVKLLDGFAGSLDLSAAQPSALAQRLDLNTALGLSLSKHGQTINFLHTYAQKARDKKMHQARLAGIAAVTTILILLAGYHAWQQIDLHSRQAQLTKAKTRLRSLNTQGEALKKEILALTSADDVHNLPQLVQLVQAKHAYWQKYADRIKPVAYLGEIFSRLPKDAQVEHIYAYLQEKGSEITLSLDPVSDVTTERILYSDPGAGISLRQIRPEQKSGNERFDSLVVVKGLVFGQGQAKQMILNQLTTHMNDSPLFQVWDSRARERISPSLGPSIEFHLLLKMV